MSYDRDPAIRRKQVARDLEFIRSRTLDMQTAFEGILTRVDALEALVKGEDPAPPEEDVEAVPAAE